MSAPFSIPLSEVPKVPKTFFFDGVCLSESGLTQIRSLSMKFTEKKRPRWKRAQSTHPGLVSMVSMSSERSEDDVDMDAKSMAAGKLSYLNLPAV